MGRKGRPPNLGKIQAATRTIERSLRKNPELHERTDRCFAGELEEGTLATHTKALNLRIGEDAIERAGALIEAMEKDPELAPFGKITQSSVLRLAIYEGLKVLEARYKQRRK